MKQPINVLFLCTGNSARSILAECLLNKLGQGQFRAFSAGSRPVGRVNPFAIELLQNEGMGVEGLRSKSWDEFSGPDAPELDFIFTVCGNAAGEVCPIWPGKPATAHWGIADPASATGDDAAKRSAFRLAYARLNARLTHFVGLPLETMDGPTLKQELDNIGQFEGKE